MDVAQIGDAALACGLFVFAGIGGLLLRNSLPERHRDRDTANFIQLVVGAMVTFLAIVLGLLTASAKAHFDDVGASYRHFATELVLVDQDLREMGAETTAIRAELRGYLAAVIFSTWPEEPAPSGTYRRGLEAGQRESATLTGILQGVELNLRDFRPVTPLQIQLEPAVIDRFNSLVDARWAVIETGHPTIADPFYRLMLFWAALVFFGIGLCAPRNLVVLLTVIIFSVSVASDVYVILELDDPVGGLIAISSTPLREALAAIDRP